MRPGSSINHDTTCSDKVDQTCNSLDCLKGPLLYFQDSSHLIPVEINENFTYKIKMSGLQSYKSNSDYPSTLLIESVYEESSEDFMNRLDRYVGSFQLRVEFDCFSSDYLSHFASCSFLSSSWYVFCAVDEVDQSTLHICPTLFIRRQKVEILMTQQPRFGHSPLFISSFQDTTTVEPGTLDCIHSASLSLDPFLFQFKKQPVPLGLNNFEYGGEIMNYFAPSHPFPADERQKTPIRPRQTRKNPPNAVVTSTPNGLSQSGVAFTRPIEDFVWLFR